ncbi:MAG: hypothetical protein QCI00_07090, partial [Candidatus Thermoplasmatota archaeon]|nr:hypothetical protein [Candidatus Thermoplasmatota archaeon]
MKKLSTLFVCMLMIVTILPSTAMAGDEENPEITDDTGDAFGYIDIVSIWFYEQQETPEFLYVSMKINEPSEFKFQQTFAVFWRYNSIRYACSLHMGFSLTQWKHFTAGKDDNKEVEHIDINGTYHVDSGIITWIIPKVYIGDPQHGDVLTNTWSNAF